VVVATAVISKNTIDVILFVSNKTSLGNLVLAGLCFSRVAVNKPGTGADNSQVADKRFTEVVALYEATRRALY
jgi:hypothetical protein